jgi:hypothetical protein
MDPNGGSAEQEAEEDQGQEEAPLLLLHHHLQHPIPLPTPPVSPVRAKRMDGVYLQREEEGRAGRYGKFRRAYCVRA